MSELSFIKMLEGETTETDLISIIDELGNKLGKIHQKFLESEIRDEYFMNLIEINISMICSDSFHEDFYLAMNEYCDTIMENFPDIFLEQEEDVIRDWNLYDIYKLDELAPWCFDEYGLIIDSEFEDILEDAGCTDIDGDGDPDVVLAAASAKSLNKSMKNIKAAAGHTVKKQYDKYAGLSKEKIRAGYIKCPPGTPAEGKIRKKGSCSKKLDKKLSKALKKSAKTNVAGRKQAAKKAGKTKKRLGGRRREK